MGVLTESRLLSQLKKGQGKTNEPLDHIVALVEQHNGLLPKVIGLKSALVALRPGSPAP
jgi:hypothetical protein